MGAFRQIPIEGKPEISGALRCSLPTKFASDIPPFCLEKLSLYTFELPQYRPARAGMRGFFHVSGKVRQKSGH